MVRITSLTLWLHVKGCFKVQWYYKPLQEVSPSKNASPILNFQLHEVKDMSIAIERCKSNIYASEDHAFPRAQCAKILSGKMEPT